jgi:hypothetical protein
MINVRDRGAAGDGKHDDTAAFQSALDEAAERKDTVFAPAGTYLCSTLRMHSYTGLAGTPTWTYREHGGTIIRLADENAPALVDITGTTGVTLYGLCLDGAGVGTGVHGVLLNKPDYGKTEDSFRIERCRVGGFTGCGVWLEKAWCFSIRHSMLGYNRQSGLRLRGWDAFITDNWFSCNGDVGFDARQQNSMVIFTANRVEYNKYGGVILHAAKNYNITGNCLDRCGGPGLELLPRHERPSRNVAVTGNVFQGSGGPNWHPVEELESCHLRMEHAAGVTVVGNSMTVKKDREDDCSPRFGIIYRALTSCVIKDNVGAHVATEQFLVDKGEHGDDVVVRDNVGGIGTA